MKLSKQWKTLSRDQKRALNQLAKNNRVMLKDGNLRRVSGHKAFELGTGEVLIGETLHIGIWSIRFSPKRRPERERLA